MKYRHTMLYFVVAQFQIHVLPVLLTPFSRRLCAEIGCE